MRYLVITAVLAACSASLLAQSAPIKMGLWEKTMVTSIANGPQTTMKAKDCVTPEEWQRMTANIQKPHEGCKMNTVKTGNGYTYSGTCSLPQGSSLVMNGSQTIQDSEHILSENHSTTTINGKTRKSDIRSTSRFLSSSCGSVKPGDPEIENH
jgi:threonine synthase